MIRMPKEGSVRCLFLGRITRFCGFFRHGLEVEDLPVGVPLPVVLRQGRDQAGALGAGVGVEIRIVKYVKWIFLIFHGASFLSSVIARRENGRLS